MLESIDHVNLVVSDLEGMAEFYSGLLGLTPTKRATISGPWIEEVVGLTDVEADVIYLDLPEGPRVELLRYNRPPAERPEGLGRSNTPGLRHLAFRVRGIDGIVERLAARGVRFFSAVHRVPDSQVTYAGGVRKHLVYFHDPEGNLLELCEYR
jgi:catechol 2,3-dioxygenase-like lactoylglutathione lyase family enzyme